MNSRSKTITLGIATFAAAAVVGYFGALVFKTEAVPTATVEPTYEEALPVVVPVAFDGDVEAAIEMLTEQTDAARTVASELEITLEPIETSGIALEPIVGSADRAPETDSSPGAGDGTPVSTTAPGTTTPESTVPGDTSAPEAPSDTGAPDIGVPPGDGFAPPEERVSDTCTDGGGDCPEGISGTILAIRDLPPLAGIASFDPYLPGTAPRGGWPECPARDPQEGTAYFGVSTNRPALITLEYRTIEWRSDRGGIPWTRFSDSTSGAGDSAWARWFADDTASASDPAAWIKTCITLTDLPPRDDYQARFVFADKDDPSIQARPFDRLIRFVVPGPDGLVPGAQRRPTTALPLGIDQLFIGVTRTPAQDVAVAARLGSDVAACEIAGDERSIYTGPGTVRSVATAESEIGRSILDDPAYPYFVDYSVSLVERLDLEEGTDYVVCIYWLDDGPAFDRQVVTETEAIAVSTPEAYRPKIMLQRVTNLIGDVDRVTVSIPGCNGRTSFDLTDRSVTARGRTGILQTYGDPIELCTFDSGLNEVNRRGIRVDTTITRGDGTTATSGTYLRTNVNCRTVPCLLRLNELALVALPDVTVGEDGCGTGFGTGCLSGTISAGDAVLEIRYMASTGSGGTSWSLGRPSAVEDAPPPLADDPRVAVTTDYELIDRNPERGARATLTFVADRPVTLDLSVADVFSAGEICSLGTVDGYSSATLAMTHTITLDPLCLGQGYRLTVNARDEAGRLADVVGNIPRTLDNSVELNVPTVMLTTEISATVSAPHAGHSHTVYLRPVRTTGFDAIGTFGRDLGWTWPAADRDAAQRAGWQMFGLDGQANACGREGASDLEVFARRTSTGVPLAAFTWVPQQGTNINVVVDIYENRPVGGVVLRDCARGDLEESIVLAADLSIEQLRSGVTLTSDSGLVEFTIRAVTFDPNINR